MNQVKVLPPLTPLNRAKHKLFCPQLFTHKPSLKHTIKSNTFSVNKLTHKQFYWRKRCQNYLVNKTPVFTLNIGLSLTHIPADPLFRLPGEISHIGVHSMTFFFFKYQNFRISYISAELIKVAPFQVGRRTFFREHLQRRWHLPRAHKWSTNFCVQLYTINFQVTLVLTVGSSSIGTPIIYYQTLQMNQNIPLPPMRTFAVAELKFEVVSHCPGCDSAVLSSSLPQLHWGLSHESQGSPC